MYENDQFVSIATFENSRKGVVCLFFKIKNSYIFCHDSFKFRHLILAILRLKKLNLYVEKLTKRDAQSYKYI